MHTSIKFILHNTNKNHFGFDNMQLTEDDDQETTDVIDNLIGQEGDSDNSNGNDNFSCSHSANILKQEKLHISNKDPEKNDTFIGTDDFNKHLGNINRILKVPFHMKLTL